MDLGNESDAIQLDGAIDGSAYDLRSTGEQAHFTLEASRVGITNYVLSAVWADANVPSVSNSASWEFSTRPDRSL